MQSRGGYFSQRDLDIGSLERDLKEAQLKKAIAAAKNAGNSDDLNTGRYASTGKANTGNTINVQDFAADKETDYIRAQQSMAASDARRKDLALSSAKQQSDLELERRRQAAALALGRITGFRG